MSCLSIKVTPVDGAILGVTPAEGAALKVTAADNAALKVTPNEGASLKVTPANNLELKVIPVQGLMFNIGEVCSVSGGTIVVLAASDGPLRTRDGGYLLLDPEANPAE